MRHRRAGGSCTGAWSVAWAARIARFTSFDRHLPGVLGYILARRHRVARRRGPCHAHRRRPARTQDARRDVGREPDAPADRARPPMRSSWPSFAAGVAQSNVLIAYLTLRTTQAPTRCSAGSAAQPASCRSGWPPSAAHRRSPHRRHERGDGDRRDGHLDACDKRVRRVASSAAHVHPSARRPPEGGGAPSGQAASSGRPNRSPCPNLIPRPVRTSASAWVSTPSAMSRQPVFEAKYWRPAASAWRRSSPSIPWTRLMSSLA